MVTLFVLHCFTALCQPEASRPEVAHFRVEVIGGLELADCEFLGRLMLDAADRNREMVTFRCVEVQ